MARDFAVIKAEVDAEHPTPTGFTWNLYDETDEHDHDDRAVAITEFTMVGVPWKVELHISGYPPNPHFYVNWIRVPGEGRPGIAVGATFEQAKIHLASVLERRAETSRLDLARHIWYKEVSLDLGLTYRAARLLSLAVSSEGAGLLRSPSFDPEVLAYSASTQNDSVVIRVIAVAGDKAVVTGVYSGTFASGLTQTFSGLVRGANVIRVTVSAPSHLPTTYTVTINKT